MQELYIMHGYKSVVGSVVHLTSHVCILYETFLRSAILDNWTMCAFFWGRHGIADYNFDKDKRRTSVSLGIQYRGENYRHVENIYLNFWLDYVLQSTELYIIQMKWI